jgi:hypothetical protein
MEAGRASPVFLSLFAYAYAKISGVSWPDVLRAELEHPDKSKWPGFRTVGQASRIGVQDAYVDGSTLITKARSRAAGKFLDSHADVWLTVDDDVFAEAEVLGRLVVAARATRGLVAAPCVLRDGRSVNVQVSRMSTTDTVVVAGLPLLTLYGSVGFGLVAVHRAAVAALASNALWVGRDDGRRDYPALFLERVRGGQWVSDDVGFCLACQQHDVPMHLLLDAATEHAGMGCLMTRELELRVRQPPAAALDDVTFRRNTPVAPSLEPRE